jgi:GTP-binding protein
MKPIVAIVGRPNVGKSTFFNRVTRTRDALVSDSPGLTRDRHFGEAHWDDTEFILVDTGGFAGADDLASQIAAQVHLAIDDAEVIIFMMDGRQGLSPYDREIVDLLRPISKPVFYAVNKIDGPENEIQMSDFYGLGIEKLYPLSAEHRYGLTDLLDDLVRVIANLQPRSGASVDSEVVRLAVVGRPNVGKSSLINCILGEERLLVSDVPGTTRDVIDTLHRVNQKSYLLIDTAGIRRKGKVSRKLEKFSIIKSLRSLDRCDVALVIIDASEGITEQDITIAGYAHERGCGCVFLLNKWDLVEKDRNTLRRFSQELKEQAKFLGFAPVLSVSALTGQRVPKIFKLADEVYRQYSTRVGTGRLNKVFETAIEQNTPALHRGRRIKFFYATQIATKPPTIVCFVNYPEAVHFSYQRYLVNRVRHETGLDKTPVRLFFRKRERRKFLGKGQNKSKS